MRINHGKKALSIIHLSVSTAILNYSKFTICQMKLDPVIQADEIKLH